MTLGPRGMLTEAGLVATLSTLMANYNATPYEGGTETAERALAISGAYYLGKALLCFGLRNVFASAPARQEGAPVQRQAGPRV